MTHTTRHFYNHALHNALRMTFGFAMSLAVIYGADAAVAQRVTANANTAAGARQRVQKATTASKDTAATATATDTKSTSPVALQGASEIKANTSVATISATAATSSSSTKSAELTRPKDFIIEDKTSQFDTVLEKQSAAATDASANKLAETIRNQRAALDAESAIAVATAAAQTGQNTCDTGLRDCMKKTCGNDFTKCTGDTDTTWGGKMDKCRRDLKCSGEEYRLFAAEIKADRDLNAQLASYTAILNCGNEYNDCIVAECGATFGKCLGKSAGDSAISKCAKIAKNCQQQDSGLAARVMNVFGELRVDAEKEVVVDEKRLTELQKQMDTKCSLLGATLDRRTLDCVYTVNFYVGTYDTPYASKKAYAGSTFDCTQDWFGINATTFKENAYRLTRNQESATSAMLGSGVGMAAGSITSGAIGRAIDTTKAKNALNKAKREADKDEKKDDDDASDKSKKSNKKSGKICTNAPNMNHVLTARYNDDGECIVERCVAGGYEVKDNACVKTAERQKKDDKKQAAKQQKRNIVQAAVENGTVATVATATSNTAQAVSDGASNVAGSAASMVSSVMSGGVSDVASAVTGGG